jgi:hypothetical protein
MAALVAAWAAWVEWICKGRANGSTGDWSTGQKPEQGSSRKPRFAGLSFWSSRPAWGFDVVIPGGCWPCEPLGITLAAPVMSEPI